ncbi:MAG: DUF3375 domain-containing protein, partial [Candidatus Competibacteraceae bacterium]|nr:DUF3375 domain-containing protein [Candidatus Competibacteraceae bacterium]
MPATRTREYQARFRRLYQEQAAWRLLRADNAPLVLAFVAGLFEDSNEVPFPRARVVLEAELGQWREDGLEVGMDAGAYLRQWIAAGWLRELDDQLSRTDACETALRFCQGLDQRETTGTASHLRIVQDAVRDLTVALSPDPQERLVLLTRQLEQLQREIDDLKVGVVAELSEDEQRERIREVYQLATVLTGDFRRVEDEIRQMDQALRVRMIESQDNRGEVLLGLLEQEALLQSSDAGRAFEGFYRLLCDQNRITEFREQLRALLERPAAGHLSPAQAGRLRRLVRELSRESERVFQVRRRTQESLRAFVESGAHLENRTIGRLLGSLERLAVQFKDGGPGLRTPTRLT